MTRGRQPLTAIREAIRIAQKRGEVRRFMNEREMICNFVIYQIACVAHVRVKRVRRILAPPAILEREAREDIAALRSIAYVAGVSRELWACSPKGSYRFFQVHADSLLELDRSGRMIAVYPNARQPGSRSRLPAPDPAPVPDPGIAPLALPAVRPDLPAAGSTCPPGVVPEPSDRDSTLEEGTGGV